MCLLALLLGLAACSRPRLARDELVVLIESPPKTIDPRYLTVSYDFKLSYLCYARLVSVDDPHLLPVMDLAESVTEVPAGPGDPAGELRYDVVLRPARFWDGTPVTAADVAYTFDKMLDERTGNTILRRRFADAGLVTPVAVRDARTVRLTLRHGHASLLTDLDLGILKRGSIESGHPIGAGPFVPEGEVGEVSRFTRNLYYYGGPPPIGRLTVRVVRDANSRLLSLVGGSADLTQTTISPLLYDAIASRWRDRLRLEFGPSAILLYLGMNQTDPHLRDVRVRQALAYAIDRQRIIDTKLHGHAALANSMLPAMHWAHSDDVVHYTHDPARAKALLDAAGFPDPDGDGPLPRFTLGYKTSTDALPVAIARIVAAQLAEVGIAVEVRPLEFSVFLSDVKKGNFELFTLYTGEVAEPNLMKRYFHSAYIPTPQNPDAGHNRVRYKNPEVDRLLDEGEREMDHEKRRALYARVQRILSEDLPILPLWHKDNDVVLRDEVQGYVLYPSAQFTGLAKVWKK